MPGITAWLFKLLTYLTGKSTRIGFVGDMHACVGGHVSHCTVKSELKKKKKKMRTKTKQNK